MSGQPSGRDQKKLQELQLVVPGRVELNLEAGVLLLVLTDAGRARIPLVTFELGASDPDIRFSAAFAAFLEDLAASLCAAADGLAGQPGDFPASLLTIINETVGHAISRHAEIDVRIRVYKLHSVEPNDWLN